MRPEVASQVHLQPGPYAAGAYREQAYCLFVWGPQGQGVAHSDPTLPTVSLGSSVVWHLFLEGQRKGSHEWDMSSHLQRANASCYSFGGPATPS